MKYFATLTSAALILGIVFYALVLISKDNEYTSVRKYLLPQEQVEETGSTDTGTIDTPVVVEDNEPPVIEISNYENNQVVTQDSIVVEVKVLDNMSTSESVVVEGDGERKLVTGYNPIVVAATDEAGNVGVSYIIIEKK